MKKTRILSALLALCMAASLLTLPAGAASAGTFSDVSDRETAVAVESLRLMGVLDGYANGTFRPGNSLTRAQFCKMAVYAMAASDQMGQYLTVTVFPDVKPSYWASAYINMAAKGKAIIAGYPDGRFHPDRTVSVGQAVTILMRMLGYKDADVGGVWPNGYMSAAASSGLTDGLSLTASAALTRGQAARLFLNLLRTADKDGKVYAGTIATVVDDVMLVSSSALAANGTNTAMQAGSGTTYQMANKTSSGILNGLRGMMLLNKAGKALTFVPYATGSTVTVTVSEATSVQLKDTAGKKYAVSGDTTVYRAGKEEKWSSAYAWLTPGTTLTLYLGASGSVEYVFAGSGSVASAAVVVASNGSTAGFSALAGNSSGYTIYKDGTAAGAGDLRQYDVATYSSATNTIRVCDTRLTGYYEGASPNLSAPEKITVLGQSFTVLASAYDTLSQFKLGDRITLLLTEDNQVAGALAAGASGAAQGNALGIVTSLTASSATVNLLSGLTITGKVDLSDTSVAQMSGQLVRVSAGSKGYLAISQVTGGVSGSLDVAGRKLGTASLRDNVVIYQQSGGTLTSTSLSQLQYGTIPSSGIVCAVTDWAGRVSILVLGNAAGAQYRYGLSEMNATTEEDEDGQKITTRYLTLHTPAKDYGPIATGYDIPSGAFIGVSMNADQSRITGYTSLTKLGGVSNSAWIGETAVTACGRTCTVPTDVLCYNRASGTWVTLGQAHAFSSVSSLYVDSYNVVRVVEVGQ